MRPTSGGNSNPLRFAKSTSKGRTTCAQTRACSVRIRRSRWSASHDTSNACNQPELHGDSAQHRSRCDDSWRTSQSICSDCSWIEIATCRSWTAQNSPANRGDSYQRISPIDIASNRECNQVDCRSNQIDQTTDQFAAFVKGRSAINRARLTACPSID